MLSPSYNNGDANNAKVNEILDVIISYARFDFSKKTTVDGNGEALDAIGAGVNMLGEELESSTLSLKEKEYLIKEIHHRVKNNLQIVSSLLTLQSENIKDPFFLELMSATRFRITSMALVHEMLYSTADLTKIEISEYIKKLSKTILTSLSKPGSKIRFKYDIAPGLFFDIDRMIPLGLILNEIITNSIKYAFPKNKGMISISLIVDKNKNTLNVSDDGIGFPKGFNFEKQSNLGLQLIKLLTEQLNGNLNTNFEGKTFYSLTFS